MSAEPFLKKRFFHARSVWISLFFVFATILLSSLGVFSALSEHLTDRFFLPLPKDPRIVIVAIDESSLQSIGHWPWSRSVHARLIRKIREAGAKTIAYDVNFSEATNDADDQMLANEFVRTPNLVLPTEKTATNTVAPYPLFVQAVSSTGNVRVEVDADGVVRRVPWNFSQDGSEERLFALEVARVDQGSEVLASIPTDARDELRIHYPDHPGRAFPVVSAKDLLEGDVGSRLLLKNAVVFVGSTAHDLHDEQLVATSFGHPMSGVEIHASLFYTVVHHAWLRQIPVWIEWIVFVFIAFLLGIGVTAVRPRRSWIFPFVAIVGWGIASFFLFDGGWIADILWPILLSFGLYGALLFDRWIETEQHRQTVQRILSRYLSPTVVQSLLRDTSQLALGGQRRFLTMLFSDIRGFTSVSETVSPEALIRILNVYLGEMTNLVFEEEGVLDKYIGDAVMAFWNAPFDQADHAIRAVKTALRMQARLKELNASGVFPDGLSIAIGIGINSGEVVVGNVGSAERFDYTVIGDQVNLASRVESLTKEYGVSILITENTRREIGDRFLVRALDRVAVKGKKTSVTMYEVVEMREDATDVQKQFIEAYERILNLYWKQQFVEAAKSAQEFRSNYPEDVPIRVLLEHIDFYKMHPPGEAWDGGWTMTKK